MKHDSSVSIRARLIICALFAVFIVQAMAAARRDSVTIDEFAHLPVGLYALSTGDLSLDPINPPHTRMLAALPLLLDPPAFDPPPGTTEWDMGYHLMERNGARYHQILVRARTVIVAAAVLLGLLVVAWAQQLYGTVAAVAAAFLFAFSPTMLAHGHLLSLDLSGSLGFTATAYATWRLLERPTFTMAALTGVALGLASLLKLSGFVLVAVVVVNVSIRAISQDRGAGDVRAMRWLGLVLAAFAVALLVINAGYGFSGTFAPLERAVLEEGGALAGLRASLPWLRLPLPLPLVNGIDMILNVGRSYEPSFFLAGEFSDEGWWYYHLAAFALKTPLPIVIGAVVSLAGWPSGRAGRRAYCLFVPLLLIFAFNALFNSLQIGVRHVLPAYPLLFVAIAGVIARLIRPESDRRRPAAPWVVGFMALWLVAGTVAVAPRYLQYFNEMAGGPEGGHRWLVDSNVDWGQDLVRLDAYLERHGIDSVALAYFGRVDPRVYGVRFTPLERGRSRGIAVVSASYLMGRPYIWLVDGQLGWVGAGTYAWLQRLEPIDRVGAMFVYDLE